jgi:GxxExxY protein
MTENEISRVVVISAIEVHRVLGGPGLLESVYEEALVHELTLRSIATARQVLVPIRYKGVTLASPLRLDLVVEGKVVVECKAIPRVPDIAKAQTLTYLRASDVRLALLINFGEILLKNGITRIVHRLEC